jgi:hypothetical protein
MTWVAVAVAAGSVVTAGVSYANGQKQSSATKKGANASIAEQARQYDQTRSDLAPYRAIGTGALGQLGKLYGINTAPAALSYEDWSAQQPQQAALAASQPTKHKSKHRGLFGGGLIGSILAPNPKDFVSRNLDPAGGVYSLMKDGVGSKTTPGTPYDPQAAYQTYLSDYNAKNPAPTGPDTSVFFESPDYQFNLGEGQKAIDRSLVARGRGLSGAGVKEGVKYASGMASNEFGNFYNRLANLAGLGQTATNTTAQAGMNAANNNSATYQNLANQRASIYGTQAQGLNNAVQGGLSNYMLYQYLNKNPS